MSPLRLTFCATLCLLSCFWAALALFAQSARLDHRSLIATIRNGEVIDSEDLDEAIAVDSRALRTVHCNNALQEDALLLLAQKSDTAMLAPDLTAADAALAQTESALAALLSCTPMDGKAWLDFALVSTYREGFTKRALGSYEMSAKVAPGESWLAEKRLLFALKFRPLLDQPAREVALRDIAVLKHAHPNRIHAVMKAAEAESPEALAALFSTAASD